MSATREELAQTFRDACEGDGVILVELTPPDIGVLLEALEPERPSVFEGWADVELMGHRSRIAYLREVELGHRGFLELTWTEANGDGDDINRCEIYSPAAVFSITPLDGEAEADQLREARRTDFAF